MSLIVIEVLSAGIFTTIQDQGRFGYRHIGVPTSGSMDSISANLANALLGNDVNCAVVETTIIGPVLQFQQGTFIAITGAISRLTLNDKLVHLNTVIPINKGDVLKIGKATTGLRSYLAVSGGIQAKKILKSRSYYSGITKYSQINKDDILTLPQAVKKIFHRSTIARNPEHFTQQSLQVFKGPEFNLLDKATQENLCKMTFAISQQNNRMAYKLESEIKLSTKDIITSSVQPGTVQLTPAGELIILMRDCQTTGGYARVLQLTNQAIDQLAQKTTGKFISFNCY